MSKCNKIRYNTPWIFVDSRIKISKGATALLRLLKSVNIFVIFCNFPIDEMEIIGYNACMKKCRSERRDIQADHEARQIIFCT